MPVYAYIIIIFILAFVVVFTTLVLPLINRRATKKNKDRHGEMVSEIKVGTKIIIIGGIYGEIVKFDKYLMHLKIAEDVVIVVDRNSIIGTVKTKSEKKRAF